MRLAPIRIHVTEDDRWRGADLPEPSHLLHLGKGSGAIVHVYGEHIYGRPVDELIADDEVRVACEGGCNARAQAGGQRRRS